MSRRAFCGNRFIHLNIAEIHEEGIGGQKTCAPIADQGIKMSEFADCRDFEVKFVKYPLGEAQMLQMSGRLIVEMILVENELSCDWTSNSLIGLAGTLKERYEPIKARTIVAEPSRRTFAAD